MDDIKGRIVRVKAGREKNSWMVVLHRDEKYLYLADGKERKLEKPKKKNIKHISITADRIDLKEISNKKLKSVLREYADARTEED